MKKSFKNSLFLANCSLHKHFLFCIFAIARSSRNISIINWTTLFIWKFFFSGIFSFFHHLTYIFCFIWKRRKWIITASSTVSIFCSTNKISQHIDAETFISTHKNITHLCVESKKMHLPVFWRGCVTYINYFIYPIICIRTLRYEENLYGNKCNFRFLAEVKYTSITVKEISFVIKWQI